MSLVTVDQGLSSASNLLVLIAIAHLLEPIDFGRFSLLFLVYGLGQALVRAAVSVPVLVHPGDADQRPRVATGAGFLLGVLIGGLCLAGGGLLWAAGSVMAPSVVILGCCLPVLLVQDVGRYLAFARGVPGRAIVLDTIWLVLAMGGFVVAYLLDADELATLVLVWGGAGIVSGLGVLVQYGVPRGRDLRFDWFRARWGFVWKNLLSTVVGQAVGLTGAFLMTIVSSPISVAVVRASLLVGRPSATIQSGIGATTAAEVAREDPADRGSRMMWRALWLCVAVALANMVALLLLPDVVGQAVLADVWALVKPLRIAVGLFGLAAAGQTAIQAVMLGRHQMTQILRLTIAGALVSSVCIVVGASLGDATGAVWGTTIGQTITSLAWGIAFLRYLKKPSPGA